MYIYLYHIHCMLVMYMYTCIVYTCTFICCTCTCTLNTRLHTICTNIFMCTLISGVGAVRCCPKCYFVNPPSKKRCQRCGEFMVGRNCPECGTLNHNRTRECFKCNAVIEDGESCLYTLYMCTCTVGVKKTSHKRAVQRAPVL